ncbi:NAD(P)-dependent oxidoreductase [Niveibacterium sp. SC-1]|uniref:NAD-dependent epimerase/dehydratase family protein n=1 Tax=Niveibacterium sp. SC-1 TaxID=3135646 RepID=UPI00311D50A2
MQKILVTGGSGKLGRAVVRDLVEHGYTVINADIAPPREPLCRFLKLDLEDLGQTIEALSGIDDLHGGIDAVVHLAAIPAPGLVPDATAFRINTMSTYNVFSAARRLGIRNVVWASSETLLGLPFETFPDYIPIDEAAVPRPESSYSLSKLMGEEMAREFCRWDPQAKVIGLRFSNVMEPQDYAAFPGFDADAKLRKWNLWGYIDARDGAQAVRKSLLAELKGAEVFIIANADTVMRRPNRELVEECFPGVPFNEPADPNATLLSIDKARAMLGYEPEYSWRKPA